MIRNFKKLVKEHASAFYLAETGIKPLDWLIDFFYSKYRFCISKYEAIERSIFWARKMHKSYDFDGSTIYEMLYHKLDRMDKCMTKHGHCVWNSCPEEPEYKLMVKLRRARDLAKNLSEKDPYDYLPDLVDAHNKKWGKLDFKYIKTENSNYTQMKPYRANVSTPDEKLQERKEHKILFKKQNEAYLDEMVEFFELLKYNTDSWWD